MMTAGPKVFVFELSQIRVHIPACYLSPHWKTHKEEGECFGWGEAFSFSISSVYGISKYVREHVYLGIDRENSIGKQRREIS